MTLRKGPRQRPCSLTCNQSWELQQPQASCSSEGELYPATSNTIKIWGQASNTSAGWVHSASFSDWTTVQDHCAEVETISFAAQVRSPEETRSSDFHCCFSVLLCIYEQVLRHICLILHLPLTGQERFLITALRQHCHYTNTITFKSTASLAKALHLLYCLFCHPHKTQSRVILSLIPTCYRNGANSRGNRTQLKVRSSLCVGSYRHAAASPAHLKQGQQLLGVLF